VRWPLSLLFRGDRDAPPPGGAAAMRPGEPGLTAAAEAGVPSRPAAWRSLPPIQRSVGDAPLTARTVPFGRELAGLRSPDPILRPLAHDLAADGPAGLVSGIATPLVVRGAPIAAPADHAELPPLPASSAPRGVQRRARTVSAARTPAPAALTPAPGAGEPDGGAMPLPVADVGSADLPAAPPRVLPVVAPSATAPALAATRVAPATAPEAARAVAPAAGAAAPTAAGSPVQRSAASAAPPVAPPTLATPTLATPPSAPPPVAPSVVPDAILDAAGPTPAADAHAARPAQPRSLGESRRLGLGAPLAGRPSVQRAAAGPNLPLARAGRTPAPPASPIAAPPPTRRAAAAEAALPVLRIASASGRPATPREPGAARPGDEAGGMPPAVPAGAGTDGGSAGPATLPVQRSVELPLVGDAGRRAAMPSSGGADAEPAGAVPGEGLSLAVGSGIDGAVVAPGGAPAGDPIAGSRPHPDSAAAAAATGPLAAGDVGAAPPSQPTVAPAVPSARSVPLVVARSLRGAAPMRSGAGVPAAPSPTTAGRATTPAGAAPGPGHVAGAPAATRAPGAPSSGSAAPERPVAQRSPFEDGGSGPRPGALVGRASAPAAPGPSGPAAGPVSEPLTVSRLAEGGGSASLSPAPVLGWSAGGGFAALPAVGPSTVQRAVAIDEVASQVDAAPAAGAAEGGAGAAGAGGAGQDYEEIADRVYDRIRSRFATELLLDRERMGLLIDG